MFLFNPVQGEITCFLWRYKNIIFWLYFSKIWSITTNGLQWSLFNIQLILLLLYDVFYRKLCYRSKKNNNKNLKIFEDISVKYKKFFIFLLTQVYRLSMQCSTTQTNGLILMKCVMWRYISRIPSKWHQRLALILGLQDPKNVLVSSPQKCVLHLIQVVAFISILDNTQQMSHGLRVTRVQVDEIFLSIGDTKPSVQA